MGDGVGANLLLKFLIPIMNLFVTSTLACDLPPVQRCTTTGVVTILEVSHDKTTKNETTSRKKQ